MEGREMTSNLLDLPLRKKITEYIRRNPGVHFRQISRDLDLAIGQLDFHLNALVKGRVIVKQVASGNSRYYVRDRFTRDERRVMSSLRREIPRGIVLFLLDNPGSTPTRILENFSFTFATMSYHLRRLEKQEILKAVQHGRKRLYYVRDPETVRSLLVLYSSSLADTIVDSIY
jgi:predicted transcriptional regulator